MKYKIKTFLKLPLLLVLGSLVFLQCNNKDNTTPTLDSLDATLSKSTDLTIFKAAVAQAKLNIYTQGPGPFTILAPTDAAFTAAGITAASLPSIDSITLTALVLNHFQNIARTSYEFPDGPTAPMASIAGYSNYSYKDKAANKIYVSGATITERDIKCGNGIIHKINKVLIPPTLSILTILGANPNYSLMVQAITKAALTGNTAYGATTAAPVTVFALSNTIMTANGYDATTIAGLTGVPLTTLTNILKYHIATGRIYSSDFKLGNLKTVFGTNVVISISGGVNVKGASNASPFLLGPTDISANNGVVHAISGMLTP